MDYKKLADLLFPHIDKDVEYFEKKYPKRDLKDGQIVTRFAPSPTGIDLHLGHLFSCLVSSTLVRRTNGVYFLRIEDTDKKREIPGSVQAILKTLKHYNIEFTEGRTFDNTDKGNYGSYRQSDRAEVYQTIAKKLVSEGKAYPCFCPAHDLEEIRKKQVELKTDNIGYSGEFARCRKLTLEEIAEKIKAGKPYVIRFKCPAKSGDRFKFHDEIKGDIEMNANLNDVVILKSDGIPPYNFAHVCDDHFMRTNLVVRGEEYSGTPVSEHHQLFEACGFEVPKYAHNPHLQKLDNGKKRKLSKSKDPEASVSFYSKDGYPVDAVLDYLLGLVNSDFEEWRVSHPNDSILDFDFKLSKMSSSGSLFDIDKLNNISKNFISRMTAEEVYEHVLEWAREYDVEFYAILKDNKNFAIKVFDIDRGGEKPRKDIAKWSEVKGFYDYMFLPYKNLNFAELSNNRITKNIIQSIMDNYTKYFDEKDDRQAWFDKIKTSAEKLGFCINNKEYKLNPDKYVGNTADYCAVIRLVLTGRTDSPDLMSISKVLGVKEMKSRVEEYLNR